MTKIVISSGITHKLLGMSGNPLKKFIGMNVLGKIRRQSEPGSIVEQWPEI